MALSAGSAFALANQPPESQARDTSARPVALPTVLDYQASESATTLRDAWLNAPDQPSALGYAFMLRRQDRPQQQLTARRLLAELDALRAASTFLDHATPLQAAGLDAWQERLEVYSDVRLSRTPGRSDPASLVAYPRHNPSLATVQHFGFCASPDWVEAWHPQGVTRLPFQPGMTISSALEQLTDEQPALSLASERAWRISPLGQISRVGIAAYNHESIELTPGSRVVLPLPWTSIGAQWVNESLPGFLATRLPGDDCVLHSLPFRESFKGPASP